MPHIYTITYFLLASGPYIYTHDVDEQKTEKFYIWDVEVDHNVAVLFS